MATTLPPPGTMSRVLRHLGHVRPPQKKVGGKFGPQNSSFTASEPKYVQPKDRIAYWNILPGDEVQVTVGGKKVVDEVTGKVTKVPYEGIVATIDRERNLAWLRGSEDDKGETKIPKSLKNIGSRYKEPEKGAEGGFTPTTVHTSRPIHYSNLRYKLPKNLKLPKDVEKELNLKEGVFASRLTRSKVRYSPNYGHFVWKRYAVVPSDNGILKIEIPWKLSDESRPRRLRDNASVLEHVDKENWTPWDPSDPLRLLSGRKRTSPQALKRFALSAKQREENIKENKLKAPDVLPVREGGYAGFAKKGGVKPPLIPQPPTPAEQIWQTRQDIKQWIASERVENHIKEGGKTFTALDYLEMTPKEGPSDLQWSSVSPSSSTNTESISDSDGAKYHRSVRSGKLIMTPAKEDLESWPIELLMSNDLENPLGLRHRMRRWHRRQAEKKVAERLAEEADDMAVEVLRDNVAAFQVERASKNALKAQDSTPTPVAQFTL